MFSCSQGDKTNSDDETQNENQTEETQVNDDNASTSSGSGCEEFLNDYESWADEFIAANKKLMENPADATAAQKVTEKSQEMQKWATRWTDLVDCSNNEEYQQRMQAIAKRIEDAMNEMAPTGTE